MTRTITTTKTRITLAMMASPLTASLFLKKSFKVAFLGGIVLGLIDGLLAPPPVVPLPPPPPPPGTLRPPPGGGNMLPFLLPPPVE